MKVQAATTVAAPPAVVHDTYASYADWPQIFPTIKSVRLLRREGPTLILDIGHVEGAVINELTVSLGEIRLAEIKRHYDAVFVNRFQASTAGTRFTVVGDIRLKGAARLLRPVLPPIARLLMRRLQLEPIKRAAEERVRTGDAEVQQE